MKTILKSTLILTLIVAFNTSCSNNDNDAPASLTEFEKKLVGTWNTSPDLTGNTYTYNSDKTAVYVNTRFNGANPEVTIEKGAWDIINGNNLIEYYPDKGDVWDNNWRENPFSSVIISFENNNRTQKSILIYDNSVHYLYKE